MSKRRSNRRKASPKPARVIVWNNGMVMAFDAGDQQIPYYQGSIQRVRARVRAALPEECWCWRIWPGTVGAVPDWINGRAAEIARHDPRAADSPAMITMRGIFRHIAEHEATCGALVATPRDI